MKLVPVLTVLFALAGMGVAQAQVPKAGAMTGKPAMSSSTPATALSQGEVLKVYPKGILLKHGPIENIGMGAMTMQFGVTDAKLLKSIRPGDKVRFAAERIGDEFVVSRIEVIK